MIASGVSLFRMPFIFRHCVPFRFRCRLLFGVSTIFLFVGLADLLRTASDCLLAAVFKCPSFLGLSHGFSLSCCRY